MQITQYIKTIDQFNMWTGDMFKENSFETPERKVNPIRPKHVKLT